MEDAILLAPHVGVAAAARPSRALPPGRRGTRSRSASHSQVLAEGRRALSHFSPRDHGESHDGGLQHGDLPDAGLPQGHDRCADADPEGCQFSLPRSGEKGGAPRARLCPRGRSGAHARRRVPASRGVRGDRVRGSSPRETHPHGPREDDRCRRARRRGDRSRGHRPAARAPHRRPLRRSLRPLLGSRAVSRFSDQEDHAAHRRDLPGNRRSASPRRRTGTWGRPRRRSSCRSSR